MDDDPPRPKDDALHALMRQDLARLSVSELDERVEILEAEVARTTAARDGAARVRSAADSLFKR